MKKNKAYKYRMYPNKNQETFFAKNFGSTRFIYNKMLYDKIKYYEEHNEMLYNTPAQYKKEFPWLKEVDSLALSNTSLQLESAYKNFFRDESIGLPKFKSKKSNNFSYTTNNQKGTIKVEDNYIKLPKIGKVKIKKHREIPENCVIKSATIKKYSSGKYYVSVLVEYESQILEKMPNSFLGLDFSMHELYIDNNGCIPEYPKYYRKVENQIGKEQRKLSRMVKGSNNYVKEKKRIALLHERVKNQREDFLHKASRNLVNNYECICIEDLNMKNMSQVMNFGKSVSDNGWGKFINYLEYKLEERGGKLVKVDKYFASSQICSYCGYKNKELKDMSIRKWECPNCGISHNRDVNAAVNILNKGIQKVYA